MANVYFNELSANGHIPEQEVGNVIKTLVSCVNWLKGRNVDVINADRSIGAYQITDKQSMYQLFDDQTKLDEDQKALLIATFSETKSLQKIIENHDIIDSKCNNQDAIGLTVASDAIEDGLSLSLNNTGWDNPNYNVDIKSLDEDANVVKSQANAKNASNKKDIALYSGLFPLPAPVIPTTGKQLYRLISPLYPHLSFSDDASKFIFRTHSAEIISSIYDRLNDLEKVAKTLNNRPFQNAMFASKASPESDTRDNLPELDITFKDGIKRHCSWHLRYTPDAGRIHFSSDAGDGNTIYVGYIGQKIGR